MSEPKETVSFYLPKDLIKEYDKIAKSCHMNRSQFMEWLLTKALPFAKTMQKALSQALDDVFKTVKEPEDVAT